MIDLMPYYKKLTEGFVLISDEEADGRNQKAGLPPYPPAEDHQLSP